MVMNRADLEKRKSELHEEANALILESRERDRTRDPHNHQALARAAEIRAELRDIAEADPSNTDLTIKEMAQRLKLDSTTVQEIVRGAVKEAVQEGLKEYLTLEELADRLNWSVKTIKNKMGSGIFQKGVHYFSPRGVGPRFKWTAVQAWMEEKTQSATSQPADAIPMARGYLLGDRSKKPKAAD